MNKFYLVVAVPNGADDFQVIGVLTRKTDADEFVDRQKNTGQYICIGRPQYLDMAVILDLLVKDRLRELAEPIVKLAAKKLR